MYARTFIISAVQLAAWFFVPVAMAQTEGDTGRRGGGRGGRGESIETLQMTGPTVRCFSVTRANPTKIADHLGQLYGRGRVIDFPSTGKIVFMGTTEEIRQVESILAEVDIAELVTETDPVLTIIPIHHRRAHDILSNIQPIVSGLPENLMRISADDARLSIIVLSRSSKALAAVKEMVAGLDTPTEHVPLEFAFFKADLNATGDKPVIPEDLQDVSNELSRFGEVTLLGRLFADATEGGRFKVEGQIFDHVNARVEGRVEETAEGKPTRISVEAKAVVEDVQTSATEGGGKFAQSRSSGAFAIETQLLVMPGQFVVVGGSPAGLAQGQSIMLAVRANP